jgi:outer membrane protein assembly factor BamB
MIVSPNYLYRREMVTRRLVCLDLATGRRIWQRDVFSTPPEAKSAVNSYATPTPVIAGNTIVAAFGPGIAAFSADGARLWSTSFPRWIEGSVYGAGSSPVADNDTVYVTLDREYKAQRESRVVAYSLQRGDERWSTSSPFAHDGYTTPVIYGEGARRLLITHTSRTLVAYVASSGSIAWTVQTPIPTPIPSVVAEDGKLYVTGGMGGDGFTAAYRLRQDSVPDLLWANRKSPADVSSPVLYKGRLYTIRSTGIMVCYDAVSGRAIWRRRLGSGAGVFYASLVAADDRIYAVRSDGITYVIAAEDEFRLESESSLGEDIYASPAFATECLLLRTASALYCAGRVD